MGSTFDATPPSGGVFFVPVGIIKAVWVNGFYKITNMTADQLKSLMMKHGWDGAMVATVAMVSGHTVRAWLRPITSKAHRNMKPQARALLEEKSSKIDLAQTSQKTAAKTKK